MIYSEWGPWEIEANSIEENAQSYKMQLSRTCISGPIGGDLECEGSSRKNEHFTFSQTAETYNDAKSFCKNNGGQLFGNIDGSIEQLDLIYSILGSQSFWFGIEFDEHNNVWRNLKGEDVTELVSWGDPDFENSDNNHKVYLKGKQAFRSSDSNEKYEFVCDMFYSEWSEWGSLQRFDGDYEFTEYYTRQCVTGTMGGVLDCEGSNQNLKLNHWLVFAEMKMSYDDALENCELMGGQLFGDLDGTKEQLDFLASKFEGDVWLAINSFDLDNQFVHINGRNMAGLIIWGENMPSGTGEFVFITTQQNALLETENVVLDTTDFSQPRFSICQMVFSEMQMGWAPIVEETENHKKVYYREKCKHSPYKEDLPCYDEPKEKLMEYIEYVKDKKSYFEAVEHCESIGGQLFGDLDGTFEQIEDFAEKLGSTDVWFGVTDWGHEGIWMNLRGETLSLSNLFSAPNPDNANNNEHFLFFVNETGKGQVLVDSNGYDLGAFACQMIFSTLTEFSFDSLILNNATHWIMRFTRTCVQSQIGDPPGCAGSLIRITYYHTNLQPLEYDEAVQNCKNSGSLLFDGFAWSPGKNNHVVAKMGNTDFWVGISDKENEGIWVNQGGQQLVYGDQNVRIWANGHPKTDLNNLDDGGFFKGTLMLESPPNQFYLMDAPLSTKLYSFCFRSELV